MLPVLDGLLTLVLVNTTTEATRGWAARPRAWPWPQPMVPIATALGIAAPRVLGGAGTRNGRSGNAYL